MMMEGLALFVTINISIKYLLQYIHVHDKIEDSILNAQGAGGTAYDQLIGNTPLIRLHRLSALCKRNIFLKVRILTVL